MASQFVRKITDTTSSEPIKETTTSGDLIVTKDNKVLINLNGTLKDLTPAFSGDELNELKEGANKNADDIVTANTAIKKNAGDIKTANTNIKKNTDDIVTANKAVKKNTDDIVTANTNIKKNADDIKQLKADVAALKPAE